MLLKIARFLSLFCTALATGVLLAHVLEIPGKVSLPGPAYVTTQQALYQDFGTVLGILEPAALIATLVVLYLVRQRRLSLILTASAAVCLAGMLLVWALFIAPINGQLSSWTPTSLPANWSQIRDRWEALHALRAAFSVIALIALLLAVLLDGLTTATLSRKGEMVRYDKHASNFLALLHLACALLWFRRLYRLSELRELLRKSGGTC